MNNTAVDQLLGGFLYHLLFVQLQPVLPFPSTFADQDFDGVPPLQLTSFSQDVMVLGVQEKLGTDSNMLFVPMTSLSFIGTLIFACSGCIVRRVVATGQLRNVFITPNSMHLFVSVTRRRWEINSLQRAADICNQLAINPRDPFLIGYTSMCTQMSQQFGTVQSDGDRAFAPAPFVGPDLSSFTWFVSAAPAGSYCPSFVALDLNVTKPGYWTLKSYVVYCLCARF